MVCIMVTVTNSICDLCSSSPACCVCICTFPLLKSCKSDSCDSKHRRASGFHFDLHPSVQLFIQSEQERSTWSTHIYHTVQTQKAVLAQLKRFDAVRNEVVQMAERLKAGITSLADEYLAKIDAMSQRATTAFHRAVHETTANVVNSAYAPTDEVCQWIVYFRSMQVIDPLFDLKVVCELENSLQSVFRLVVKTQCGALGEFQCEGKGLTEDFTVERERLQGEIAQCKEANQRLSTEVDRLTTELTQCQAGKLTAEASLKAATVALQRNVTSLQQEKDRLSSQLSKAKSSITALTNEIASLKEDRDRVKIVVSNPKQSEHTPMKHRPSLEEPVPEFRSVPVNPDIQRKARPYLLIDEEPSHREIPAGAATERANKRSFDFVSDLPMAGTGREASGLDDRFTKSTNGLQREAVGRPSTGRKDLTPCRATMMLRPVTKTDLKTGKK